MINETLNFRILVIDDNKSILEDFMKILNPTTESMDMIALDQLMFEEKQGYTKKLNFEILTASQGQEGFNIIEREMQAGFPIALAFVDMRMPPGWDGIETIKKIWSVDKNIQIVICTAYSDYSWEETVDSLGETDNLLILKKPFDGITVRQIACSLTRKWQLAQESFQHTNYLEQEIKARTDELLHSAMHDSLTNLPNRFLFTKQLEDIIKKMPHGKILAVFLWDLDRFKLINDSLTHAMGDVLLEAVATRLKKIDTENEFILARFGGDEFAAVIRNLNNLDEVNQRAQYFLDILHHSFRLAKQDVRITACIGVSVFPTDGHTAEVLIRNADIAVQKAKERGPNNFQRYTENIDNYSLERLELENQLLCSLEKSELVLHYQPEFNLATGRLKGVEALIRWRHPEKGLIQPLDFIPLAEETGFILPLGEWVLRTACQQNKVWQEKGFPRIRTAVNVSGKQFDQSNLVDIVKNVLEETNLDPQFLELELTENIIIGSGKIIENIRALKSIGVQIALDDFGTGYSNLQHLKRLTFDRIKIDKEYVGNININLEDEAIIRAIISMASSLNVEVLAEGVETSEQLEFLKKEGCDEGQGYYFSQPLPPEALESYFESYQELLQKKANPK